MERKHIVFAIIVLALIYTLADLIKALFFDKNADSKFIRRKLTFFLFMVVSGLFYLSLKFMDC